MFADITEESERLHRLVEDVVALNRFGEHAGDIGAEPVLLQRLLPRVVMSEQSRWPGVGFEAEIESNLPTVVADPTYVEQVFRNLLSNAAKYGGAGTAIDIDRGERRRRGHRPDPRRRSRVPGRGVRAPVRAVLPLPGDLTDRQRGRDRAVRRAPG